MMVFWNAGLVLLATPKTGSQALQLALSDRADLVFRNPPSLKHMSLQWYRNGLLPLFPETERHRLQTVAVIREPIDWLGSWYRYRLRDDLIGQAASTRGQTFSSFVTGYLEGGDPRTAGIGRQASFVSTRAGRPRVDCLFAYDDLERLMHLLRETMGPLPPLNRVNASPFGDLELAPPLAAQAREKLRMEVALHLGAKDTPGAAAFDIWAKAGKPPL